jgi:hypothetical protein
MQAARTLIKALALAALLALAAAAQEETTPVSPAHEKWDTFCNTQRLKPGVREAGHEAVTVLEGGGVAGEDAVAVVRRAAEGKEWGAEQIRKWSRSLDADRGKMPLLEYAYTLLGEKPPAKPAPEKAEAPGARWFGAGQGPLPRERWTGGDVDRADAYAGEGVGSILINLKGLERVDRVLVYLMKDASSWWSASMTDVFKGSDEYFLFGGAIVPKAGQETIVVTDRNKPVGWKAAYVFLDRGGKRTQLEADRARWLTDPDVPEAKGAFEVPRGYKSAGD